MRGSTVLASFWDQMRADDAGVVHRAAAVNRAAGSNSLSVKVEIAGLDQHRISWVETEPTVVR